MDLTSLRCLINSISRFIHLVTCSVSKTMPAEKDQRNIAFLLKHLKQVLDDVADHKAPPDETLSKECEKLDVAVNEGREFLEKWSPRMSKILYVLQSKPLVLKIQISSVKLCFILCRLFESSPTPSSLSNAKLCMQEFQNLKLEKLSEHIEDLLKSQKEGKIPGADRLMIVVESLNLRSNQELLSEFVAVEKERLKAEEHKIKGYLDQISETAELMSNIRDCVVKLWNFKARNGLQIPSYFRCPLSLELMLDPVIVASGQTYERAAILKWLDHGLATCPKTGNPLAHKNLIPNYTVKALIANWCNINKVELSNNPDNANTNSVQSYCKQFNPADDLQFPPKMRNPTSRCSLGIGPSSEPQKVNVSNEDDDCVLWEKLHQSSHEHSCVHSRSESASSAISSIDSLPLASAEISRKSSKQGELTAETVSNGSYSPSFSSQSGSNDLTTTSHVEKLVKDLKSASTDLQTAAAGEIRFLTKYNMENRFIIGKSGSISPLISLLHSDVELMQEHAVTALLNLSINEKIKARIAEEGALEPLIHVLRTGNSGAKENAAAALFSLSLLNDYRIQIGRSGAINALVELLRSGTLRGMKDAATALFNLSIFHENKARIVQAGAVKYLVGLMDPAAEMVDKAVALLANLSTITEGCLAIAREGGIPLLIEIVETGSQRGKENAASILLQLCINSPKYCRIVLQEGAVPPLVALSLSGTPRAKEKAQQLLSHFRNQRESALARGRS